MTDVIKTSEVSREEFNRLLDAYANAAMAAAIRAERNRPDHDQRKALDDAASIRQALNRLVFGS